MFLLYCVKIMIHNIYYRIKIMSESGLLLKFEEMHRLPTKCSRKLRKATSSQTLSLEDIVAPFTVFSIGMVTATFALVTEIILSQSFKCLNAMTVNNGETYIENTVSYKENMGL